MIEWTDELKKQFRTIVVLTFVMLVVAPILYIVITQFIGTKNLKVGGEFDIMFDILLFLAMTQPIIIPLLEKFQISTYNKNPKINYANIKQNGMLFLPNPKQGSPMALYMTVTIIKSAIVESIYIYGFVTFMLTGDVTKMLYFYPIGIAWTLVYFPTKSKCEKFLEKVSSHESV